MSKKDSRFESLFSAARSGKSSPSEQPEADSAQKTPARQSKSTNPDYVRSTVYLPKHLHKKLKAAAAEEEQEMSDIVASAIATYFESRKGKN